MLAALLISAGPLFAHDLRLAVTPGENGVAIVGRDLVVLEYAADRVSIFRLDGKGRFGEPVRAGAGRHPYCAATADFDGDGKPDLAIANHDERQVTLLLGDDHRRRVVPLDVKPHAHCVAAADFDGDGHPDLAVNDKDGKRVVILWGPHFTAQTAVPVPSAYFNVAAGDLDGDG